MCYNRRCRAETPINNFSLALRRLRRSKIKSGDDWLSPPLIIYFMTFVAFRVSNLIKYNLSLEFDVFSIRNKSCFLVIFSYRFILSASEVFALHPSRSPPAPPQGHKTNHWYALVILAKTPMRRISRARRGSYL